MHERVTPCPLPPASSLAATAANANFCDAFMIEIPRDDRVALEIYLDTVRKTPGWVHGLMAWRNRLGRMAGIRDLGRMDALDAGRPAADYRVGERIGIFTLYSINDREVVLGDSDKHLDVKLSILKDDTDSLSRITVTTVVHIHNWLGRCYMLPVAPLHKRIVPAILARAIG